MTLPKGPYSIIYADPPWQFKNYSDQWHEGKSQSRWVGNEYGLMTTADIGALPVGDIAASDSTLFLWATMPTLPRAIETMNEWGFTYKTCAFTWVKTNANGSPFTGMGFWTRANAELCLLGTKGHPKRIAKDVRQVILSGRRAHSQKPDEARERIVRLMGDLPRIELFAREKVAGWDAWGDEIDPSL